MGSLNVKRLAEPVVGRRAESLAGSDVEVWRRGNGAPILLLHGLHDVRPDAPFAERLAQMGEVVAPTHPGFGGTARKPEFSTLYDLIHHYRGVLEEFDGGATVIGFSFGGWIAAELAAARAPMSKLVLVAPLGVKFSGREERDIAHFFNTEPREMLRLGWSDSAARPKGAVGVGWPTMIDELDDEELLRLHASNDALSLYGWQPHMYNPRLKNWLHRIDVPTLVLWGANDGIVSPDYGRRYADAIPGARFETIAKAGHHPELEQPGVFIARVGSFLGVPEERKA
jgi:pimeloyl-ACP methyl ester carboxylesterase